ncbi:MAG: hypothetical protein Q9199_002585 [Rusavskia elegans]
MSRDTGDPHLNAQTVRDMEAHSGRNASPNVTDRLWTRLRTIAQTRVEGPVDEAVEAGAKLFSYDPTTFLADFRATKSRQMARPDRIKMPSVAYADLYILTKSPSQLPSALILFSTTRVLQTFKLEFTLQLPVFSPMSASSIGLFHLTHAVFRIALNETRNFMEDVKQEIFDMSLQSRVHPSKERFQYLLYLSDSRKYARVHMTRNKELLDEVQQKFKSLIPIDGESQEARLLEELVGKVKEDLEYVEEELAKIGNSIEELRKEVLV